MQINTFEFTIDDYEQSTKEFEKYVNTIPKKVPIKLTKTNTVGSLVKNYLQKSNFTESQELGMLTNILHSLESWGKHDFKPQSSDKIIKLCERSQELSKQLEQITKKLEIIYEDLEAKTAETNGFTTQQEIEDVIKVLTARLGKDPRAKDNEKILLQIQDLKEIIPLVRYIEKVAGNAEKLEQEKETIKEILEMTVKSYEEIVGKN
ncbi:hypothetical protein SteCoe_2080 [Stentor coeruleus]|uniref:Uncharacterized protein n=1 Tax=Stentor coeruleus TaxID=5963 RepID=A0A1R2D0F9_9CILI|nr:hypothetical protein SteCoe_2080 [Stentor coeruleus]